MEPALCGREDLMAITRRFGFPRLWGTHYPYADNKAGMIRVKVVDGIPHTWAIARPGGMYTPNGAPHYLAVPDQNRGLQNQIVRSGAPTLGLPVAKLEMDPSNPLTWQRQYRFT